MKEAMVYDFLKHKKRKVNPSFQLFDKVVLILNMFFSYLVVSGFIWLLIHAPERAIGIVLAFIMLILLIIHMVKTIGILKKSWNSTEAFHKNIDYLGFFSNMGFAMGLFSTLAILGALNYSWEQKLIALSITVPATILEIYTSIRFARKAKAL